MDDDITRSFERLVRTDPWDEQRCDSDQARRLLAESVLPRFV
jgi:hypothetical protein